MDGERREDGFSQAEAASALLLLQFAASRAAIGPFARRDLVSPQTAARCYEIAGRAARSWRPRAI